MTELDDKTRAAIRAQLDAIDKAGEAIELAMKPFNDALLKIHEARGLIIEPYGEIVGSCDHCDKLLFEGELGRRDGGDSGVIWCADCGPTYRDWKDACERVTANPDHAQWDDDVEHAEAGLKSIAAHVERGGSLDDKLPAFPL